MSQQTPLGDFTQSALSNLRSLVDVNTIIGDPISTADGTVIIPVSKVTFGYASAGSDLPVQRPDLFSGGTGGGVTISPLAFLVVRDDKVELLQLQTADNTGDRIVNTVPAVLDKLLDLIPKKEDRQERKKAAREDGSGLEG